MNGRFPFDQHNNARRQQQINAANGVRAALGLTPNVLDEAYYTNLQQQQQQQNHHQQTQFQLQRVLHDAQLYDNLQRQQQEQQQQQRSQHDYAFQQLLLAEQAMTIPFRSTYSEYEQQLLRQLQRESFASSQNTMAVNNNSMGSNHPLVPTAMAMGQQGSSSGSMGTMGGGAPSTIASTVMGSQAMGSSTMGPQTMGSSNMRSQAMGSSNTMGSSTTMGPSTIGGQSAMASPTAVRTAGSPPLPPMLLPDVPPKQPAKRKSSAGKASPTRNTKKPNARKPKRPKTTATETPAAAAPDALGVLAGAAGLITHHDGIISSIAMVLKASQEVDNTDAVAGDLLTAFAKVTPKDVADGTDEIKEADEELVVETPFFRSVAPEWPPTKPSYSFPTRGRADPKLAQPAQRSTGSTNDVAPQVEDTTIDPWWPSINAVKRERRNVGLNMDEDDFVDTSKDDTPFRVNEPEVRNRLANQVEPGVLEKLPHCRIHLLNSLQHQNQGNTAFPELYFCVQVTDLYPNDPMLHCSSCGTWRHAKCGGRCTPSTGAAGRDARGSTMCDLCFAETPYLEHSPVGAERLERQRMEHSRQSLATSAVIRHFSNSKNGGTYKWPMGSVSTAHISGHIRSVHVRHEKAEKQWSDMTSRLARSLGFRARDRVKNRQREFERLLSSLEDAESFTDRHNMYIFLMRDIMKDAPAGFENEERNIFDPADDEEVAEMPFSLYTGNRSGGYECERQGCVKQQRFDSRFCSDACGVACLEMDLLRTLDDAGEVHPSFLRTVV